MERLETNLGHPYFELKIFLFIKRLLDVSSYRYFRKSVATFMIYGYEPSSLFQEDSGSQISDQYCPFLLKQIAKGKSARFFITYL